MGHFRAENGLIKKPASKIEPQPKDIAIASTAPRKAIWALEVGHVTSCHAVARLGPCFGSGCSHLGLNHKTVGASIGRNNSEKGSDDPMKQLSSEFECRQTN